MDLIDLHVHTTVSDGTLTPAEVVSRAVNLNLKAIAITDHDTVNGIAQAKTAALSYQGTDKEIEIIPGVEISAQYLGRDIHILGLYVDETNAEFKAMLDGALQERDHRNEKMIENLRADGIDIKLEDLYFKDPDTVITRAHFARFLTEQHYVKSKAEAFDRYLNSNTKYYVKRTYMTPDDAITAIKNAGGIPVLAHPLLYGFDLKGIETMVAYTAGAGIAGIETIYSANTGFDEGIVRRFANKYGLLMTGGSDFHGANKPQIELGIGRGNLKIPYTLLTNLKAYLGN